MTIMVAGTSLPTTGARVSRGKSVRRNVWALRGSVDVHACSNVTPVGLRQAGAVPVGDLYWTPRGLAVALLAVALFTLAAVFTVVVQFMAVSDAPLDSAAAPEAARVAVLQLGDYLRR